MTMFQHGWTPEARAAACGRLGMGPAEIAEALGWSCGEMDAGAARWSELAAGRARARDAALGWWEGRSRCWAAAPRPAAGLWGKVMAGRFGEAGYRAGPKPAEPARPRREITNRDRAKAILFLLAQNEAAGKDG